jgi:cytochrome P450
VNTSTLKISELPQDVPIVEMDPQDPAFNHDPYPTLEKWRELGPVVFNKSNGRYLVLSYKGCQKVMTKLSEFDSQHPDKQFHLINTHGGVTMEAVDDRRTHHQMRSIWQSEFERSTIEQYRELIERVVTAQVDPVVARLRAGETIDAIPNMTRDIPAMVISEMLGIDVEMGHTFGEWSDAVAEAVLGERDDSPLGRELLARGAEGRDKLQAYVRGVVDERRGCPVQHDLISKMVHDDYAKEHMSEQQVVASCAQLVLAGNETTSRLMGTCIAVLGEHPDQRKLLAEDRSLIPQAIEEIHRWKTIVQAMPRHANSDESTVEGVKIPKGTEVWAMFGAANRDPERWDHAGELDILREPQQNLAFAFGIHICLGLNLARLESEVLINQILDKMPDFELAAPIAHGLGYPFPTWSPIGVTIGVPA